MAGKGDWAKWGGNSTEIRGDCVEGWGKRLEGWGQKWYGQPPSKYWIPSKPNSSRSSRGKKGRKEKSEVDGGGEVIEGLKKPRLVKLESNKVTKERARKASKDLKRGQKKKAPKAEEDVKKGTKEKASNPKAIKDTIENRDKDARRGWKGGSSNSQVPGRQDTSKGKPHRPNNSGKGTRMSTNKNLQ